MTDLHARLSLTNNEMKKKQYSLIYTIILNNAHKNCYPIIQFPNDYFIKKIANHKPNEVQIAHIHTPFQKYSYLSTALHWNHKNVYPGIMMKCHIHVPINNKHQKKESHYYMSIK